MTALARAQKSTPRPSQPGAGSLRRWWHKAWPPSLVVVFVVIAWEIAYFNFFPDFLDQYNAHALARMREAGESPAAIQKATERMAAMAKLYTNPLFNSAVTFMEVFPVGLIMTLVSAGILRRKPGEEMPAAVTA